MDRSAWLANQGNIVAPSRLGSILKQGAESFDSFAASQLFKTA
jgi:hypothetical protein